MVTANKSKSLTVDALLIYVTIVLLMVGVAIVLDSSYPSVLQNHGSPMRLMAMQAAYCIAGFALMNLVMRINYLSYRSIAIPLLIVALVGLAAVNIPGLGVTVKGATRWLKFPVFQLQPSEFAKLLLVIFLAAELSDKRRNFNDFVTGLVTCLLGLAPAVVLIEREPDLGTAAVVFLAGMTMMYIAGARIRHLASIVLVCLLCVPVVMSKGGHRTGRIESFVNLDAHKADTGYQQWHGVVAVGTGGIKGLGIGAGREKFYLPEASSDYVFATIAEETGFIGSLLLILGLFTVSAMAGVIAARCAEPFGKLLAAGISATIAWQSLINIAVVTASIPATGVPLPFISSGGSSVISLLIGIGILVNIAQTGANSERSGARVGTRR